MKLDHLHFRAIIVFIAVLTAPLCCFCQKSHGLEFDSQQYKNTSSLAFFVNLSNPLPERASVKQFCPKPLSQRMENTSTGWAAAYGALTIMEAQQQGVSNRDEIKKICFSPVFNYFLARPDDAEDCSIPIKLPKVLESMRTYGTPRYMDFRKSCPSTIGDDVYLKAYKHRIADYYRIFKEDDKMIDKVEAVKKSLANGYPVVTGMFVTPSFENVKDEFWQPREHLDPEVHPGQAMVVVGYDDTKFTGAFEVMNSWGTEWGNDGFMWIRYKDFAEFTLYGFELFLLDSSGPDSKDLSGEVEVSLLDGTDMQFTLTDEEDGFYKTTMTYEDFTTFNLKIRSLEKSFVYVIGSDQTEEIYDIFPDILVSPAFPYVGDQLVILEVGIDDTPGSNYLVIMFSHRELSRAMITDRLNEQKGKKFNDRFHIAFYDRLAPPGDIQYEPGNIKFTSTAGKNKDLVGVIIEIQHE